MLNRGYDYLTLEQDFKTEICNGYGYTLDFKKKKLEEENYHKTCCNHKKKVNKKANSKK